MNLYFISGLGADQRAFQKIKLPGKYNIHHITWIDPLKKETLESYVKRLARQVNQDTEFALIGLSFGGVIAIEMLKFMNPRTCIIISSISSRNELPGVLRKIGILNMHRLVPRNLYKKPTKLLSRFFGAKKESDRKLLFQIFEDSNPYFLKWAVDKLLKWTNKHRPARIYHIHGESDRLLPVEKTSADRVIAGAGHLMVLTHADKLNQILEETLENITVK